MLIQTYKRILQIFIIFVSFSHIEAQPYIPLKLPDTGQIMHYTTSFGEDADYLINVQSFTDNGNGTITDNITGLIWQKTDGGEMTVENARLYCDTLTLGGYSDWRLPNGHELFTILNHDRNMPALDTNYFTKTQAQYWWSSDKKLNDSIYIFVVNRGGGLGAHSKFETISAGGTRLIHVRAVRSPFQKPALSIHFRDNNNGTITDLVSGLMWQKILNTDTLTWEQALHYCENLTLAGYSDWRLPNIKELESLNDVLIMNPSIDTNFFKNLTLSNYWSSTTLLSQINKAWYMNLSYGLITYDLKTLYGFVICLRDSSTFVAVTNENNDKIPKKYELHQNYPNPFNSFTKIKFEIPNIPNINSAENTTSLKIFDLLGRELQSLVNQKLKAGTHEVMFDGSNLSSGIYFYQLKSGDYTGTNKLLLLK